MPTSLPQTEREALIALGMTQGLGNVTAKKLIEHFGSACAIFSAPEGELASIRGIGTNRASKLVAALRLPNPAKEEERTAKIQAQIITINDPSYPSQLKSIYDPPLVLYVMGNPAALSLPSLSIVGSRHPSQYGRETAFRFAYQIASAGYSVVSGLALGIDSESHRGALEASGTTVGVLGGALNKFYPKENRPLARRIVDSGGAVISEFPLDVTPDKTTFPKRNRVVSGLSLGLLVAEAAIASGTMITVDSALEQGRAVMAIPGRIDSPTAQGCNKIIRNGAILVTSPEDILTELKSPPQKRTALSIDAPPAPHPPQTTTLSPDEDAILSALADGDKSLDELCDLTDIDISRISALIITLQIKHLAKSIPGGRIMRNNP